MNTGIDLFPVFPDAFQMVHSISDLQSSTVIKIEALRVEKNNSPITCNGLTFDADPTSRENINGKIMEIASKIALNITTADKFWKDSANVVHFWDTMESYLAWLRGLAIAIAERTTSLYAICWAKKAEVLGLTTLTAVASYDITIGW